jgi:hypothetical protein
MPLLNVFSSITMQARLYCFRSCAVNERALEGGLSWKTWIADLRLLSG